ncbi:topoisomerase DNA-binding C4 zinc finger domain-containing protein [Flavobacterium sp. YO12]|uniref:topoisomerase DNA-binding C4 zinc finger domain-containing protein n=1 Tax=Flavobacterium sp. YO12 TaxID=1920029 RepID=UPI00352B5DB5
MTDCKTGKLVTRQNQNTSVKFLGCSHYPNCNQTYKNLEILYDQFLCSSCKSRFMVKRAGTYGNFLRCRNYPSCRNTINLN